MAERLAPLVPGLAGLGSALPLLRDPLAFLRAAYARHGPIFRVRAARRRFTVLAGAEANRFIATGGRAALIAGPFWSALTEHQQCPHNMVALDGPEHAVLRRLYGDDLSRSVVAAQAAAVADLTLETVREASVGGPVSARAMSRLLVSRQVHHLLTHGADPVDEATVHALTEVFRYDSNVLLLGKWPRIALRSPRLRRHLRTADAFLAELRSRVEAEPPPGWFRSVQRGRSEHPELFTDGDVKASFMLPFVAGVDTVGSTLAFLLHELAHDPALLARIRAAVDRCHDEHGTTPVSLEALRAVDDLRGAVLETLRLYPAAFAIYRQASDDFAFGGYEVVRGTDVLVFTSSTHTDPQHFRDPERFDIERFRAPRNEHRQKFVFAPYGGGPHVCLGAGMGDALLVLTAATIVGNLDIQAAVPGRRYRHIYDPSLSLDDAFRIVARPRSA